MRPFCRNYTILWAIKVNKIFTKKSTLSFTYFVKKVHSQKNTLLSCPYFVQKKSILSKTLYSHVIFFNFLMKNPLLPCPYFFKKKSILSKQHCMDYGSKKSIGRLLSPIFHEKITALMPIFVNITLRGQK